MNTYTSTSNEHIKNTAKLAADPAERRRKRMAVICGSKLCLDALQSGAEFEELFATEAGAEKYKEAFERCSETSRTVSMVSDGVDRKIEGQKSPQGIFAVIRIPDEATKEELMASKRTIILAGIQDPGNVGTVIRTAAAFGFETAVLGPGCADVWSEKVLRASMGNCMRVRMYPAADLAKTIGELKQSGTAVIGAALTDDSVSLENAAVPEKCAIVIGSEGQGIPSEIVGILDQKVTIPMNPGVESLNAAAAAAIMMWNYRK